MTGGSYVEEGSGENVSMGNAQLRLVLPSVSSGQQVGVTPVTEIATQSVLANIGTNSSASLPSLISATNQQVSAAMGLPDITIPPANPYADASAASSAQAAKYAQVLAGISQMASSATSQGHGTINSLDMMQALATTYTYNGNFSSASVGGSTVPLPGSNSSASLNLSTLLPSGFVSALSTAMSTYASSAMAAQHGFTAANIPAPNPDGSADRALGSRGSDPSARADNASEHFAHDCRTSAASCGSGTASRHLHLGRYRLLREQLEPQGIGESDDWPPCGGRRTDSNYCQIEFSGFTDGCTISLSNTFTVAVGGTQTVSA